MDFQGWYLGTAGIVRGMRVPCSKVDGGGSRINGDESIAVQKRGRELCARRCPTALAEGYNTLIVSGDDMSELVNHY